MRGKAFFYVFTISYIMFFGCMAASLALVILGYEREVSSLVYEIGVVGGMIGVISGVLLIGKKD